MGDYDLIFTTTILHCRPAQDKVGFPGMAKQALCLLALSPSLVSANTTPHPPTLSSIYVKGLAVPHLEKTLLLHAHPLPVVSNLVCSEVMALGRISSPFTEFLISLLGKTSITKGCSLLPPCPSRGCPALPEGESQGGAHGSSSINRAMLGFTAAPQSPSLGRQDQGYPFIPH